MRTILAIAASVVICATSGNSLAAETRSDRVPLGGTAPTRSSAQPISPAQKALLAEKIAIATRLMGAALNGRDVGPDYRMWLLESMYRMPTAELRTIGASDGHDAIVSAVSKAAKAARKLGAANTELVYYPITPCRYIDTRNVGGPLTVPRSFDLANTGNSYGGSAACDPKAAVGGNEDVIGALAMNVAIVSPTSVPGFLGVRPVGDTNLSAMVNWYAAGPTVQASNAGVVTTNQSIGVADEIEFFGSSTQFVVDVFGVFAAPTATSLDCTNGVETSVSVDTATRDFNLFATSCPAGYAMVSNSCQAGGDFTGGAVVLAGGGTFPGLGTPPESNCFGYYAGSSSATIYNTPWCCRIPGR